MMCDALTHHSCRVHYEHFSFGIINDLKKSIQVFKKNFVCKLKIRF